VQNFFRKIEFGKHNVTCVRTRQPKKWEIAEGTPLLIGNALVAFEKRVRLI